MDQEKKIVLPKQWKHWCRSAGLGLGKPLRKWDRNLDSWINLVGNGHRWRINMYGEFQCGDRNSDFDRWALSNNVFVDFEIFKSRDQFVKIVKQMVAFHESTYPSGNAIADERNIEMEV